MHRLAGSQGVYMMISIIVWLYPNWSYVVTVVMISHSTNWCKPFYFRKYRNNKKNRLNNFIEFLPSAIAKPTKNYFQYKRTSLQFLLFQINSCQIHNISHFEVRKFQNLVAMFQGVEVNWILSIASTIINNLSALSPVLTETLSNFFQPLVDYLTKEFLMLHKWRNLKNLQDTILNDIVPQPTQHKDHLGKYPREIYFCWSFLASGFLIFINSITPNCFSDQKESPSPIVYNLRGNKPKMFWKKYSQKCWLQKFVTLCFLPTNHPEQKI